MNNGHAWTVEGKIRSCTFCLLAVLVASQFYFAQELLTVYAFFVIGFAALTLVVLCLYVLQKGWELAAMRIIDSKRWMAHRKRAAIWARQELAGSKSAQELKTENRNSKD